MKKPWFKIQAAADGGTTAEVEILDAIHPYYGMSARDFIAEFRAKAQHATHVNVTINSPGGSVFEGTAIYNTLAYSGKTVNVRVLGIAASIASVIAMAGDTIEMPENALMLVHNASSYLDGPANAEELRDMAEVLDKLDAVIVAAYVRRTGQTEDKVRELMAAETLLTAAEAAELGFASRVLEPVVATAEFDLDELPQAAREAFTAAAEDPPVAPPAEPPAESLTESIEALAKAAGLGEFVATWALDPTIASEAIARERIETAREILALARVAGRPEDAAPLIRSGKPLADVRAALAATLAASDQHVDTAPRRQATTPARAINPTNLWKQIDAMNGGSATK